MAKKDADKELVQAEPQDKLPVAFDFAADSGAGMEEADRDSFAIPFLRVLQKSSPQCDEADPNYIEGARAGMFYNSVSGKMYDGKQGVTFLPAAFQRRFLRWGPRGGDGGGFKGEIGLEQLTEMQRRGEVVDFEGRLYVPAAGGEVNPKKCDRIVDTRNHFGLLVLEDGYAQVLLTLSSTQIKKSKLLLSMLNEVKVRGPNGALTPPTWMNRVKVTTVPESNDQGSWHGVKFELNGFIDSKELYEAGRAFHTAIASGTVKANFAEANEEQAHSDDRRF